MQMYDQNIPPIIPPPLPDPATVKAESDYMAEQGRKDFQRHSLLGLSVLGQLLWEFGFLLSLPVRMPILLWGKLRRKR
jgi:hypothetical protein